MELGYVPSSVYATLNVTFLSALLSELYSLFLPEVVLDRVYKNVLPSVGLLVVGQRWLSLQHFLQNLCKNSNNLSYLICFSSLPSSLTFS